MSELRRISGLVALFVFATLWVTLSLGGIAWAASGERRIALIIGNGAYKEAPLKNSVNDARAMAQKLKKLGFEVIALENATQTQMNKAITQFGESLTDNGASIFYYAGHGMQVKGRNFLLPVDAQVTSETSVRNGSIDVDQLLEAIGEPSKRTNIVILDACRNNPFGRFRGGGTGLAQVSAPAGTLVAYATAPGMTASDGDDQNGAYTTEILKALDEPGLKVEDVFKKVRVNVAQATGNAQVPWEASSLVGDFYFVPKGSTVVVVPPGGQMPQPAAAAPTDQGVELAFWNSIKDSADLSLFRAYLEKYPAGSFAPIARSRLATPPPAPVVAVAPAAAPAAVPPAGNGGATMPGPAPSGPATSAFDGTWHGQFSCGEANDPTMTEKSRRPFVDESVKLRIEHGSIVGTRTFQDATGRRGTSQFSGKVGEAGDMTLSGGGFFADSPDRKIRISFAGNIVGTHLSAKGFNGSRACTLEFDKSTGTAGTADVGKSQK